MARIRIAYTEVLPTAEVVVELRMIATAGWRGRPVPRPLDLVVFPPIMPTVTVFGDNVRRGLAKHATRERFDAMLRVLVCPVQTALPFR